MLIILPTGEHLNTSQIVSFVYKDRRLKFLTASDTRWEFIMDEAPAEEWIDRLRAEHKKVLPLFPPPKPKPEAQPVREAVIA